MGEEPDIQQLLISLGLLVIEMLTLIFFVVMSILTFKLFRKTWRGGLKVGLLALGLALPSTILGIIYLDVAQLGRTMPAEMLPLMRLLIGVFAVLLLIAVVPLRMAYFHVGSLEWERIRPLGGMAGPPETRRKSVVLGAIVGLLATVLTMAVFKVFHVRENHSIAQFQKLFPGLNEEISLAWVVSTLGFVTSAAIVEEYIFRGGILGFLLRITGNRTAPAWLFITLVAFVWALLHLVNTDHPLLKLMQIFLLGLLFGGMTRRWGIGSAISGHISLNVSAVVFALMFPEG